MTNQVLRAGLWVILCATVIWSVLSYRGVSPWLVSHTWQHLVGIGATAIALFCGTRALFSRSNRVWRVAFLLLAGVLTFLAWKNAFLHREIHLREIASLMLLVVAYAQLHRERLRESLGKPFRRVAAVVLVNAAVLAGLLIVSEGVVRLFLHDRDPARGTDTEYGNPFWFQFQPFLMLSMDANVDIRFKNGRLPGDVEMGHLKTNNMGFRMDEPVFFDKIRPKARNERVVIFTGGSAAWGAGATSNKNTIAERLQAILNESQDDYRYVVVSLSSGGWIAMQSVLAVAIYGLNFDPDWIVGMDGNNDIVAACAQGYGAGWEGASAQFERYYRSYLYHQPAPPFFRGTLENKVISSSMLYRILTRQRYIPEPITFNGKWEEVERSLVFYELAYDRLLRLLASSRVKVIMSSQPYKNIFLRDFEAGAEKLQEIARKYSETNCRKVPHLELMKYFHPRLKAVSENLVARWSNRIDIRYLNLTEFIPEDDKTRLDFSWGGSPVHLSDRGQDFVARIFARTILVADLKGRRTANSSAHRRASGTK